LIAIILFHKIEDFRRATLKKNKVLEILIKANRSNYHFNEVV